MKIFIFTAMLLLSTSVVAQADTDIWINTLKVERGDDAVNADARYCSLRLGAPQNGGVTSAAFKRCMLTRGWRYSRTVREEARRTWTDPDTGLTCHEISFFGIPGSSCSNF